MTWARVVPAFAVAAVVVAVLVPLSGHGEASPPAVVLLLAASLITAATGAALYLGVRRDLRLPARVAWYTVAYMALVVAVKFVLAPLGLYEVNRREVIESFIPPNSVAGAVSTAVAVLVLYLAVYVVVYRMARRRVDAVAHVETPRRSVGRRRLVVLVVAGAIILAVTGGAIGLVLLLMGMSGLQYLRFVFSSSLSLLVALALTGATVLATRAFQDTAERARVVGDAALLVSFFWLGLYFLLLYHALWVVYLLVLTSTWPLRVVVPK